jgi:DMSO/TMAO reductase YedYZ molybdopterin-dependent catalytic subunit
VLHAGSVPSFDPRTWDFRVFGLVEKQLRLSWEEFSNLPQSEVPADMHCVTCWSRSDNHWGGLLATELMKRVNLRPEARHVMVHAENFTANLPISDFLRPTTIFALRHDGEPLTAEHGYRCASWCQTSMRGRALSGCAGSNCWIANCRASGKQTVITFTATRSKSNDIRAERRDAKE